MWLYDCVHHSNSEGQASTSDKTREYENIHMNPCAYENIQGPLSICKLWRLKEISGTAFKNQELKAMKKNKFLLYPATLMNFNILKGTKANAKEYKL